MGKSAKHEEGMPDLILVAGRIEAGFMRLEMETVPIIAGDKPRRALRAVRLEDISEMLTLLEPSRQFYGLRYFLKSGLGFEVHGESQNLVERLVMEWSEGPKKWFQDMHVNPGQVLFNHGTKPDKE